LLSGIAGANTTGYSRRIADQPGGLIDTTATILSATWSMMLPALCALSVEALLGRIVTTKSHHKTRLRFIIALIRILVPAMAKRAIAMEFSSDLIAKLALAGFAGVLIGSIIRASARWLMRSLLFVGILIALYFGAQAFGVLGK
jgi:hypothetical protein